MWPSRERHSARRQLNRCTHPFITARIVQLVLYHFLRGTSVLVLDLPLLVEGGLHRWMGEVVVVAWCASPTLALAKAACTC